ncbi:MAG: methyltransferase domain-containing protein [Hyphomicrobiales bacterium]|nr:methyltransferase domain-containing protein [Hyphomicrobiales bacterium]
MTADKSPVERTRSLGSRLRRSVAKRTNAVIGKLVSTPPVRAYLTARLGLLTDFVVADRAEAPTAGAMRDEVLPRLFADREVRDFLARHPETVFRTLWGTNARSETTPPFSSEGAGTGNAAFREAWLERKLAAVPAGSRLLDAGAGECQFRRFCSHLEYVSQDLAEYDGAGDDRGLQTGQWDTSRIDIKCDITSIPEPDASFDAILCTEVLEHLPDPVPALREMARLLKPGGVLILTAPFCSLTHFAPYHYATGFNRYFYEHHLGAFGMKIEEMAENGNYFDYVAQELRRVPSMAETYCGTTLTAAEQWMIGLNLQILDGLVAKDRGSAEVLTFGMQVVARRL